MDNRRFGIFDEITIGAGLDLLAGDLIVQTRITVDAHRHARSDIAVILKSNCEFTHFNPNRDTVAPSFATVAGVPAVCYGIVLDGASVNTFVGEHPLSVGYCPYDGKILLGGSVILTVATSEFGETVSFFIDPQAMLLTISKGKKIIADSIDLSSFGVQAWHFAATVSGDPGELGVYVGNGYTPLRTRLSSVSGFWIPNTVIQQINLGNEPFMAKATDLRRHEKFYGDINAIAQQLEIVDSVNLPWWGASAPADLGSGGSLRVQVQDPKGKYDYLTDDAARGTEIDLFRTMIGGSFDDGYQIWQGIFDSCEQDTRQTKQVYFRGKETLLSSTMIRALFGPDADISVTGKPRSISDGVARNYTPELEYAALPDTGLPTYAMADAAITAIGIVRINGVPYLDYTISADNQNINPAAAPNGAFTVETTSYGDVIDPTLPDMLNGAGHFEATGTQGGGDVCTSGSSLTIGTGSKTFAIASGFASIMVTGSQIVIKSIGTPTATFTGTVTSHASASVTVNVTSITGTGTHNDWHLHGGINQPTNWAGSGFPAPFGGGTHWQVGGSGSNKYIVEGQNASGVAWFYDDTTPITLLAGRSYGFKIKVLENPYYGLVHEPVNGVVYTTPPNQLIFGYIRGVNIEFFDYEGSGVPLNKTITTGGSVIYTCVITNTTNVNKEFVFGMLCNEMVQGTAGITSQFRFQWFELYQLPALGTNEILTGPGFRRLAQGIVCDRGPLTRPEMSDDDGTLIDTNKLYTYGYHVPSSDSPQCLDQLNLLCYSRNVVWFFDETGVLRFKEWFKPEDVADSDLDHILTASDVIGEVLVYNDLAENLTTRAVGCPNYTVLSAADTKDVSTDDLPLITRAQLQAPYQWTVTAGIKLAQAYRNAVNVDPIKTMLDVRADGQDMIETANGFYQVARNFYVVNAVEEYPTQFKLMQKLKLTYDLPTLAAGTKTIICGRGRSPTTNRNKLILWGK